MPTPPSPESLYAQANGLCLHYRRWSRQGPPLLLLHGVTGDGSNWDYVAPALAQAGYRVLALDLRGHGLSSKPERGYRWAEDYAEDVVDFLRRHVQGPAILIGHSLGAVVAIPVAVRLPGAVRALVLEDPPAFAYEADRRRTQERFGPVLEWKRLPYEERVRRMIQERGMAPASAAAWARSIEAMAEGALVEMLEGHHAYDPEDWLPRVRCPTLAILGEPSLGGVVAHRHRGRLRELLSSARPLKVVEWADTGHLLHASRPARFNQEVLAFLDSLAPPSAETASRRPAS